MPINILIDFSNLFCDAESFNTQEVIHLRWRVIFDNCPANLTWHISIIRHAKINS